MSLLYQLPHGWSHLLRTPTWCHQWLPANLHVNISNNVRGASSNICRSSVLWRCAVDNATEGVHRVLCVATSSTLHAPKDWKIWPPNHVRGCHIALRIGCPCMIVLHRDQSIPTQSALPYQLATCLPTSYVSTITMNNQLATWWRHASLMSAWHHPNISPHVSRIARYKGCTGRHFWHFPL